MVLVFLVHLSETNETVYLLATSTTTSSSGGAVLVLLRKSVGPLSSRNNHGYLQSSFVPTNFRILIVPSKELVKKPLSERVADEFFPPKSLGLVDCGAKP